MRNKKILTQMNDHNEYKAYEKMVARKSSKQIYVRPFPIIFPRPYREFIEEFERKPLCSDCTDIECDKVEDDRWACTIKFMRDMMWELR